MIEKRGRKWRDGKAYSVNLSTYAHVIAELQEAPRVAAAQQIRLARAAGRDAARRPPSRQLSLGDLGL